MPRGISPFDRLSASIATAVAAAGNELQARQVVLKRGLSTRQPREIEIQVTLNSGNLLLVECCAYKRAQGPLWIEQIDRRRRALGFASVLAISRSGLTRAARKEAVDRGIPTTRLSEAEAADWSARIAGRPDACDAEAQRRREGQRRGETS